MRRVPRDPENGVGVLKFTALADIIWITFFSLFIRLLVCISTPARYKTGYPRRGNRFVSSLISKKLFCFQSNATQWLQEIINVLEWTKPLCFDDLYSSDGISFWEFWNNLIIITNCLLQREHVTKHAFGNYPRGIKKRNHRFLHDSLS